MAVDIVPTKLDGTDLRIGIVVARFNEYAGRGEFESCMDELRKLGVMEEDVTKVSVPGALEIPFALQKLAQTGEYDALIALGAVIRGETYHDEQCEERIDMKGRDCARCAVEMANFAKEFCVDEFDEDFDEVTSED